MEEIIVVVSFVIMFALLFLGNIFLNRKQGSLFSLLGFALYAAFVVAGFFVPRLLENNRNWMWFLGLASGTQAAAVLIVRRRAGETLANVDEVHRFDKRWWLLGATPFLVLLFVSFIPARASSSSGDNPYLTNFFLERLPVWFMCIAVISDLLLFAFSRIEMHENGIVQYDNFIDWRETLSYSWWEFDLDEWLRLRIKIRGRSPSEISTVTYRVHQTEKKSVDKLLARKLKGKA